jgi:hypothetical protein
MNNKAKLQANSNAESLSAALDGEAGEFELRRLIKSAADENTVRQHWADQQLLRSAIKGEHVDAAMLDLGLLIGSPRPLPMNNKPRAIVALVGVCRWQNLPSQRQ